MKGTSQCQYLKWLTLTFGPGCLFSQNPRLIKVSRFLCVYLSLPNSGTAIWSKLPRTRCRQFLKVCKQRDSIMTLCQYSATHHIRIRGNALCSSVGPLTPCHQSTLKKSLCLSTRSSCTKSSLPSHQSLISKRRKFKHQIITAVSAGPRS